MAGIGMPLLFPKALVVHALAGRRLGAAMMQRGEIVRSEILVEQTIPLSADPRRPEAKFY
jgi:hypothetical protein